MIVNLLNGFQATYQAFNFFNLYFSNKLFAKEVKSLFNDLGVRFGLRTQNSKIDLTAGPSGKRNNMLKSNNIQLDIIEENK